MMLRPNPDTPPPPRQYGCATCGAAVEYRGPLPSVYPFCSPRCQMVDLGRWLREEYTIDRDLTAEDLADPDVREKLPPFGG